MHRIPLFWVVPVLIGILLSLAFQPLSLWFLAIPAMAMFCFFRDLSFGKRFIFGWIAGFSVQLFGFYWIFFTIRDFGGLNTAISATGAFLFWLYQGLDLAIWFGLTGVIFPSGRNKWYWVGDAGLLFIIQSYLWPYVFPWSLGASFAVSPLRGSAAVWGGYGLTFWIALLAFGSGLYVRWRKDNRDLKPVVVSLIVSIAALLAFHHPKAGQAQNMRIAVIQPNIIPWAKRDRQSFKSIIDAHVRPTRALKDQHVDLIVWPETSLPMQLQKHPEYVTYLTGISEEVGASLMVGCLGRNDEGYTNEIWLLTAGHQPQVYGKEKLVMFSEALPWPFRWASYFMEGMGEFAPGKGNRAFEWKGYRIRPLICYEGMFPRFTAKYPADLLVNVTNDAWFGKTKASAQHLQHVQLRAVEQGVPLIRAANSGISCWVNADGEVKGETPIYKACTQVYSVPLRKRQTQWHLWSFLEIGIFIVTLIIASLSFIKFKNK